MEQDEEGGGGGERSMEWHNDELTYGSRGERSGKDSGRRELSSSPAQSGSTCTTWRRAAGGSSSPARRGAAIGSSSLAPRGSRDLLGRPVTAWWR